MDPATQNPEADSERAPWDDWPARRAMPPVPLVILEGAIDQAKTVLTQLANEGVEIHGLAWVMRFPTASDGYHETMLQVPIPGEAAKRAVAEFLESVRAHPNVDVILFALESWMATQIAAGPDGRPLAPSESPDRREVLMVIAAEKKRSRSRTFAMHRERDPESGEERLRLEQLDLELAMSAFLPDLGSVRGKTAH